MEFPSPVGGVALPSDFAPSILFATLYGLLLPLLAYRVTHRKSRNLVLSSTMTFTIERCVSFYFPMAVTDFETRVKGHNILSASYTIA